MALLLLNRLSISMATLLGNLTILSAKSHAQGIEDSVNTSMFEGTAGFSPLALKLFVVGLVLVLAFIWGGWAMFSTTTNTIRTRNLSAWLFAIIAIIVILTLIYYWINPS